MTAGVLLRYAGGEVYALPTEKRLTVCVAGIAVRVDTLVFVDGVPTLAKTSADLAIAAERARVAPTQTKTKRTGKAKRPVAAKGRR